MTQLLRKNGRMNEYGETVGMILTRGKTEILEENPVSIPLCLPKSHTVWSGIRACNTEVVKGVRGKKMHSMTMDNC